MAEPFPDNDVEQTPKEPGDYTDKQAISARISKKLSIDRFQRTAFERDWYRNILFIAGAQWITLDKGRWRPRQLPAWFPRAMTNKFAEKYNDIVASIVASKPTIHHQPATNDDTAKATAEVSERVRDVFHEEARIEDKRQNCASWLVATGNVFLMPYYDNAEKHGVVEQPYQTCVQCQQTMSPSELADAGETCPQCGGTSFMDEPNGMTEAFPIGAYQCDVVSPFEIRVDHRIPRWDDHQWFIRQRRYDVDYARDRWPEFKDSIKSDYGFDLSQYYLDVLANISSSYSYSGGYMGAGPSSPKNPKVTVYEYFELPSEDYPEGLHAIRLGMESEALVEAKPLEYEYGAGSRKGKKFLPLRPLKFDTIPGRFWGKTRLDDLIPLQTFRNVVEANLRLTAQRMGNGIWLKPKGSGVGIITGEPGQEIEYNPISVGGTSFAKPERVPAELNNLQPLIMLMNKIDDSMERVSGTFFLQGGETPPGVTAASALAFLGEKAQKAMSPILREWAHGWKAEEEMGLEICRANWNDARIRVIAGRNRVWEVQTFTKEDLQGDVTMWIDDESMFPKSQATDRANIAQLLQGQVISPADPEIAYRILEVFGMTSLKGSTDEDVRAAVKEAERFLDDEADPQVRPWIDNSIVHYMKHVQFAKTDEFMEMPKQKQDVWIAHIQATVQDIQARRAYLQAAMLPDDPQTADVTSAAAQAAAGDAMALMQSGGLPQGMTAPDPRMMKNGQPQTSLPPKPPAPGLEMPGQTPDIAAPQAPEVGAGSPSPLQ